MTGEVGQQDVLLVRDAQNGAVVFPARAEGRVSVRAVLDQNSGPTLMDYSFAEFVRFDFGKCIGLDSINIAAGVRSVLEVLCLFFQ